MGELSHAKFPLFGLSQHVKPFKLHILKMLSDAETKALLDLGTKFINSGEDVTLAHLLDLVNSTITDHMSPEWKEWSSYMEQLNIVWVSIHKEDKYLPWPKVRTPFSAITWFDVTGRITFFT
jgi:hypothetical protein